MSGDSLSEERPANGTETGPGGPIEATSNLGVPDRTVPPDDSAPGSVVPDLGEGVPPRPDPVTAVAREFGPLAELFARVDRLEQALSADLRGLRSAIERELRAESTREKVVERLHSELQEYKQDLLLRVMRPVFMDLIQLRDDVDKVLALGLGPPASTTPADAAEDPDRSRDLTEDFRRLLGLVRGLQQGIDDVLARQGVDPFTCDEPAFDPRNQRALATVPATTPEQVRTVAVRHRPGFRAGDRVIRPELVTVYGPSPGPSPPSS